MKNNEVKCEINNQLLNFGSYLVDNCEGIMLTEEYIMSIMDDFLQSKYNDCTPKQPTDEEIIKKLSMDLYYSDDNTLGEDIDHNEFTAIFEEGYIT